MFLIISISLIILFSFLTIWRKSLNFKNSFPDLFNFILTLVATFVGVFLAIDFTNRTQINNEKENVIKLLDACGYEFDSKNERNNSTLIILSSKLDSTNTIKEHIKNNPIEISNLFQSIVVNENVLRYISTKGIKEFSNCADNILRLSSSINEGKPKNEKFILEQIALLMENNTAAQKMLALESKRLEGEIDDTYIEKGYNFINSELLKDNQKIKNK